MNKEVLLDDVIGLMTEKLENGGTVTFTPSGTSMLPMLRDSKDVVVLRKHSGRLNMFDVALFRYKNGQYVMHRVIDVEADGSYVMCGDNQFVKERGVKDSDIIGVVTAFYRKGTPYSMNSILYKLYVQLWYRTTLARRIYGFSKRKVTKLFGLDENKKSKKEKDDY